MKRRLNELEENWKRALADYQNLEKRVITEKQEFAQWANANLINQLLNILDSLEKAVEYLKDKGLKLIFEQLKAVLKNEGLLEIKVLNEKFDPKIMEAVATVRGEKDKVMEVVLKGYQLNKRILRPAKVKIGKGE